MEVDPNTRTQADASPPTDGTEVLRPRGDLGVEGATGLYEHMRRSGRRRGVRAVCVDFTEVGDISSAVVAAVSVAEQSLSQQGKELRLQGLSKAHERAFGLRPAQLPEPPREPARGFFERLGSSGRRSWQAFLDFAELAVDSGRATFSRAQGGKLSLRSIIDQAVLIGVDAFVIVAMLSFLLGVVLAFQTAVQLRAFGVATFTSDVVSLGMSREFGPFITAIVLAGRSGSAIAAELATMEMREENDALRTMGISPLRVLVVPRLVAITIVTPALTLMSMFIGMAAGVVTVQFLGIPWLSAAKTMVQTLALDDFWLGLVKSVLFAWVIGFAGCYTGMHTRGGARGVGLAATRAVVASIFFILVIDSIVTTAWTLGAHG